jgi:hypothetical protein
VHRLIRVFLLVWLTTASRPAIVSAQTAADDPAARATVRLGPLALTPTFRLDQVGIDTNVLLDEAAPKRDFTFTATPGAKVWLRVGDGLLTSHTTAEWVHFATLESQRSANLGQTLRFDLPLASITPRVSAEYLNTRQRPNSEIDAYVRRHTTGLGGGVRIRLGALASLDVEAARSRWEYADAIVDGVRLSETLDRTTGRWSVAFREDLTPLTTLAVKVDGERTEFRAATERDADAWSVSPGVEFKPLSMLTGSAFVGYQRLTPREPTVPAFSGLIARVGLQYLLRDTTSTSVAVDRHVEFSYSPVEPYYVSTSVGCVLRQAIAANWDVVGRVSRERLGYARFEDLVPNPHAVRRDDRTQFSVGAGYWLSFDGRIGVDVSYVTRESDVPGRSYRGFKLGGSFGYGF